MAPHPNSQGDRTLTFGSCETVLLSKHISTKHFIVYIQVDSNAVNTCAGGISLQSEDLRTNLTFPNILSGSASVIPGNVPLAANYVYGGELVDGRPIAGMDHYRQIEFSTTAGPLILAPASSL